MSAERLGSRKGCLLDRRGRRRRRPVVRLAALALLLLAGPPPAPAAKPRPQGLDGREAQRWIQRQCDLGPRVPGSPAHAAWIRMARSYFDSLGVRYQVQEFRRPSPLGGDTLRLTNFLVAFRPEARPRLLLGSHWDSRPWADEDPDPARHGEPVLGANDGASSSALLFVLARILRESPPPFGVDLAFFDMEDMGRKGHPEEYCQGSLEMVRRWVGPYPDWVVNLDMVGSDHTEFGREAYSEAGAPELLDLVFRLARDRGYAEWNPESRLAVMDDHVPFLAAGVPAVNVIGFNDPHWHTVRDDPHRTSPHRLSRVGAVVLDLVYGRHLSP